MENLPATQQAAPPPVKPQAEVEFAQEAAKVLMDIVNKNKLAVKLGGDKAHIMFEGWATVAKFYGCTIKSNNVQPIGDPDKDGRYPGFTAHAVVLNKNGMEIGGASAGCMRDERNWRNRDNFALMSMAQTRAGAKAARMVFSWVVVLAGYSPTPLEEMPTDEEPETYNGKSERKVTPGQVKLIWAKVYEKWPEKVDSEREMKGILRGRYKVESTKDMTQAHLEDFLEYIDKVNPQQTELGV